MNSNISFCRELNQNSVTLYVDPLSPNSIELGTKQYPFWNINMATLEIQMFYNLNANLSVKFFLEEN